MRSYAQSCHWDLHVLKVREQVPAVSFPGENNELVAVQIGSHPQLLQNPVSPPLDLRVAFSKESVIVGRELPIQLDKTVLGGQNVNRVGGAALSIL